MDANTHAINQYLDEIDKWEASQEPCDTCGATGIYGEDECTCAEDAALIAQEGKRGCRN